MRKMWPLSSRKSITESPKQIRTQVAVQLETKHEPRGGGGGVWGITRKEACCRDKEGSLSPSRVSQGRPVQAAVGPVSFPVADFILAPVRLPGRRSHASLRAGAGEIDREVSVISLKEVQWREVRSQTGPLGRPVLWGPFT